MSLQLATQVVKHLNEFLDAKTSKKTKHQTLQHLQLRLQRPGDENRVDTGIRAKLCFLNILEKPPLPTHRSSQTQWVQNLVRSHLLDYLPFVKL